MISNPFRCCGLVKHRNHGMFAISNTNFGQIVAGLGFKNYSQDKGSCCKDIAQTEGRQVEPWPKADPPPPAWRYECPKEPQPSNYDPYRIKVPDVVVPPLPVSNAKEVPNEDTRELFRNAAIGYQRQYPCDVHDLFHNSPIIHPDYWKNKPERKIKEFVKETLPKLGYHGKNKYKYAFHEPWKPLDRMALLEQAEREDSEQVDEAAIEKSKKQLR